MRFIATLIKLLGPKALEEVAKALGYQHMVRVETSRIESAPGGPQVVENYPVVVFTRDPWSEFSSLVLEMKLKDFWPNLGRLLDGTNRAIGIAKSRGLESAERIDVEKFPKVGSVSVDWRTL